MSASWPVDLPQQLEIEGYQEGFADGRIRSQTDTGPGKVRPRSSAMAAPLSGSMQMTGAQIETLRAFVTDDLAGGSLHFDFPAVRGGGTILVRFASQLPVWTNLGGDNYGVSLVLEILP